MSEKEVRYGECILNLPSYQRVCASCEKLRDCELGMKTIRGETDRTLSELRSGECLLDLNPIFRECATCIKLYECLRDKGVKEATFGDMSISDRVMKMGWIAPSPSDFKEMTLEQLREFNVALDAFERREKTKRRPGLTVGAYDRELDRWVTDVHTGVDASNAQDSVGEGLSAGFWDPEKKRWVAKK